MLMFRIFLFAGVLRLWIFLLTIQQPPKLEKLCDRIGLVQLVGGYITLPQFINGNQLVPLTTVYNNDAYAGAANGGKIH